MTTMIAVFFAVVISSTASMELPYLSRSPGLETDDCEGFDTLPENQKHNTFDPVTGFPLLQLAPKLLESSVHGLTVTIQNWTLADGSDVTAEAMEYSLQFKDPSWLVWTEVSRSKWFPQSRPPLHSIVGLQSDTRYLVRVLLREESSGLFRSDGVPTLSASTCREQPDWMLEDALSILFLLMAAILVTVFFRSREVTYDLGDLQSLIISSNAEKDVKIVPVKHVV